MIKKPILYLLLGIMTLTATACQTTTSSTQTTTSQAEPAATTSVVSETQSDNNTTETTVQAEKENTPVTTNFAFDKTTVPAYSGDASTVINQNTPFFTEEELQAASDAAANGTYLFGDGNEQYLNLDTYGRCQTATALLSQDTMPPEGEEREAIGMIKPAGWHTVKYPDIISDLYLYNRCHLIGWQLSAENANPENLTTGTRYLNTEGMLPFENETADYIQETGNHVLYRVTPVFDGENLICSGILMEAQSIEDDVLSFCVYCYDVQPYVYIDYLTGESYQTADAIPDEHDEAINSGEQTPEQNFDIYKTTISDNETSEEKDYILNKNSMKIHMPDCNAAQDIHEENKETIHTDINTLLAEGYTRCKLCNPD